MIFKVKATSWNKFSALLLVLFVCEDTWEKQLVEIDKLLNKQLLSHLKLEKFEAKAKQLHTIPSIGFSSYNTIMIAGLGKSSEITTGIYRESAGRAAKAAKRIHKTSIAIDLSNLPGTTMEIGEVTKVLVEGMALGGYSYTKYKSEIKKESSQIEEVFLLAPAAKLQHVANALEFAQKMVEGTIFARDLINESPTITTPAYLANVAKTLAKRGEVEVEVLTETEVRKMGMQAFLAVTRGSDEPAKFIKLTYIGSSKKKIVLAGKSITFDTGGLSLKDPKTMETMKLDMAGGAAVLGIFKVLPYFKPKATVIGLIAACENMPGAKATKPGDVVTALNGKTIEILNTDAEGRLTLADVLSYAVNEKPDAIIDLATLTGSCIIALGEEIAGLFSNNREFTQIIKKSAVLAGEKVWEMPMEESYKDLIKSDIADLRNISKTSYGGSITAALFLQEFVESIPWVHLDIAGPAFAEKDTPVVPKGAAGFGVRTLIHYLLSH